MSKTCLVGMVKDFAEINLLMFSRILFSSS